MAKKETQITSVTKLRSGVVGDADMAKPLFSDRLWERIYQDIDTLTINVYADSCRAAQSLPDFVPAIGGLDSDCDVDQDDLDLLMENWLACVALGECDPNAP
jgi:hypothetical protein